MHDTLPLLKHTDFPPLRRAAAGHAAGQPRLPLQPELPALPRQRRAEPHRDDGRRHRRPGAAGAARARHRHARPDRRRARAEPAFPPPGAPARAPLGVRGHRPLQPDHPVRARAGGPGGVPGRTRAWRSWPRCPATRWPTSTASAATACSTAASPACRRLNALGYGQPGSRPRAESRLQPAGRRAAAAAGRAGGRLQARAGGALRHPLQPPVRAGQHADPALRQHAGLQGQFAGYMQLAARPAYRAENLDDGDVHAARQRGLRRATLYDCDFNQMLGLPARLRRQACAARTCAICCTHDAAGSPIRVADHCYGCTAGQGSSCGGALEAEAGGLMKATPHGRSSREPGPVRLGCRSSCRCSTRPPASWPRWRRWHPCARAATKSSSSTAAAATARRRCCQGRWPTACWQRRAAARGR